MCENAGAVVAVLRSIQQDGPPEPAVGICYNLHLVARQVGDPKLEKCFNQHTTAAFKAWLDEANTGNTIYPIEATFKGRWGDHYEGRARQRLLTHLIGYFQKLAGEGTPDAG